MQCLEKPTKLILTQTEIFLYDRTILSSTPPENFNRNLPQNAPPVIQIVKEPPDGLSNDQSLQGWQNLFKERRDWAIEVTDISRGLGSRIRQLVTESRVVQRSAAIAVENIKQHVGNLRPRFEASKSWADAIINDQTFLLENWEPYLEKFSAIAVSEELVRCLQGPREISPPTDSKETSASGTNPRDIVNFSAAKKAGRVADEASQRFRVTIANLTVTYDDVVKDSHKTIESFSQELAFSDSDAAEQAEQLMEEVAVLAKKVNADYEYVFGLPNTQRTTSQISRTALLHTKNFLPSLLQTHSEINELFLNAADEKNKAMASAASYLKKISIFESTVAQIHGQLANLDAEAEEGEAFDLLNFVIGLPSLYGSLLVECVRRLEWNEKMTVDSSSLMEEVATFKEDEIRRRRKWAKGMGSAVDFGSMDDMALGVEVNIIAQKQKWPSVSRQDITRYLVDLKRSGAFEDVHRKIEELAKTLDAPTKQQVKRAKAFKNGSVYDVTFGRTSLLLRGDDDLLQSMKNEKSKVEDRLKSSESRIRKLEDLLHRQSHMPKPSNNASGFSSSPQFERHATSPLMNTTSMLKFQEFPARQTSSRRNFIQAETEERSLAQRVVDLEVELEAERATSATLQHDVTTRTNAEEDLKRQVQEALSTKEDLMKNLEGQQREFDCERRLLRDENGKLKLRLEELEQELDQITENRHYEERVRDLEAELEKVRKDAADELQTAKEQADILRSDNTMHSEKVNGLERRVQDQINQNSELMMQIGELTTRMNGHNQAQAEHHKSLQTTLLHLSKDETAPEDFSSLVKLVESAVEKSAKHAARIKDAVERLQTENLALEIRAKERTDEVGDLAKRLNARDGEVSSARENLVEQNELICALRAELDSLRHQQQELRDNLATAEKDSNSLKTTVEDLKKEILESAEHTQRVGSELSDRKSKLADLQSIHQSLRVHFEARTSRIKDISTLLCAQSAVMNRLLEQIGFSVTKQDDGMIIQKVSRAASASTVLSDVSVPMNRSLSGPLPARSVLEPFRDDSILYWADSPTPDTEAWKFSKFMQEIRSFDLDAFSEAVVKRVKDAEHTARKWQREARAYREKCHRAQNEAHDKISFRSFKEGDLALFLPTRNQATRPWAAFNVGAPHFFLREQDAHKLRARDWLLARISKVEERVVDLSKSMNGLSAASDRRSIGDASDGGASFDDENPFELSDGLRWYLLDAAEEKPGAPINIGLSKVTVASANVDVKGSIRMKKSLDGSGATKTLTRSLDSRRSSSNSKKGLAIPAAVVPVAGEPADALDPQPSVSAEATVQPDPASEEVRTDLLWGP